jgi:hypothetical protein
MSIVLRRELERLLQETSVLLARPDFDLTVWEDYGARRTEIFARFQGMNFPTAGEEYEAVSALVRDILTQDAVLIQKVQVRLAHLGAELAAVATSRRALKGYASFQDAVLFQCDV